MHLSYLCSCALCRRCRCGCISHPGGRRTDCLAGCAGHREEECRPASRHGGSLRASVLRLGAGVARHASAFGDWAHSPIRPQRIRRRRAAGQAAARSRQPVRGATLYGSASHAWEPRALVIPALPCQPASRSRAGPLVPRSRSHPHRTRLRCGAATRAVARTPLPATERLGGIRASAARSHLRTWEHSGAAPALPRHPCPRTSTRESLRAVLQALASLVPRDA